MILAAKNAFGLKIQNIAGQDYNWIGRYKPFSK